MSNFYTGQLQWVTKKQYHDSKIQIYDKYNIHGIYKFFALERKWEISHFKCNF